MSNDLLDTNVVSEVWKPRPMPLVRDYFWAQPKWKLHLSVVSIAELQHGADAVGDAQKRTQLNNWLSARIKPLFEDRVLPVSEEILVLWLKLIQQGRRVNRTYSQPDLLLAATALQHGMRLVTRDFADIPDLQLLNPWEPAT